MKPVIVLSGPTATGKSALAIEIAAKERAEIVNFDSLLFYKELTIGVAKPTSAELEQVKHHFVNCTSVTEPYNAHILMTQAIETINQIHSRNKYPILVGGSGFYLQAILQGMYESDSTPDHIRKKSDELYEKEGIDPFLVILAEHDAESFERYHENDHYRVRRAVEHFWHNGSPFSEARSQKDEENEMQEFWPMNLYSWKVHHCYLDLPKEEHWKIIQARTQKMIADGLENEVRVLLKIFTGNEKPLQSIGYKEMIQFVRGEIPTIEDCIERINISTRQLAKAQRTWFKKVDKHAFNALNDKERLLKSIQDFLG